ncbi:proline-tRNA synthetase class II aaRS (ybak RNA binding domain plus tRNA synthetase) [Cryptosporidium xiaoi]|uniref:proline--tRNA ligase n=1 Tax=Cryptosporidium xiaoi TaxID=659607 RepID=A0AAV9Y681_9CRYT
MADFNKLYTGVIKKLEELSIDYLKFDHEEVPDMESLLNSLKDKARECNTEFAKNLLIKPKNSDNLYLIMAHHLTDTKMKNMGDILGINANKLRLADEDLMKDLLSVKKGSLSPLSLISEKSKNIMVYFDEKLKDKNVFVHPLTNKESFSVKMDDVVKYVESCGKQIKWFSMDKIGLIQDQSKDGSDSNFVENRDDSDNILGITADKRSNFADWYSQVIIKSEMIEYYDVSGCYILRPWSYFIWEVIQNTFDNKIKKFGVENAYFPLFLTRKRLETEKKHVEGFSPEVAWVTKSGKSDLAEPIAIRPTSETIMYPYFAKWIRSHRDLPLKLNQWSSVVRWEFKQPTPFIRTREFLWQEGHTAHATKEETIKMVDDILDEYSSIYEDLLATPVIKGTKSEAEKFAGGDTTKSIEGFISEIGRAVQAATSHFLGQNFSKMFGIEFENEKGQKDYVYQASWGLTTRAIGIMLMMHGDNKGLVLPPKVAPIQVVIVPIIYKSVITDEQKKVCLEIEEILKEIGIRVKIDDRSNYTPGWKYNHWEVKGVCLRFEVGPRDMKNRSVRVVIRDTMEKKDVPILNLKSEIPTILDEFQNRLYTKAKKNMDDSIISINTFDEVMPVLNNKKLVLAPWCEEESCEEEIKKETTRLSLEMESNNSQSLTGAMKSLCIPNDQPYSLEKENKKCFFCDRKAKRFTLFGRSY